MEEKQHICPFWMGYFLASPLRKLFQNPSKILKPYVKTKMRVLDVGSAMGFFSIPLAKLVGEEGEVICLDVQDKMLNVLYKKAVKLGLENIIKTKKISPNCFEIQDIENKIDFALAFAVVHEMPDVPSFFAGLSKVMKKSSKLLFAEPSFHVSEDAFMKSIETARENSFKLLGPIKIAKSSAVILEKI